MFKIADAAGKSQPPHSDDAETTPQLGKPGALECNTALPLGDFFPLAVEQNRVYYASRKGTHQYASPLFKLVQCLKSRPELKDCTAEDAFTRLNNEVTPNWGKLFPNVPLPSLEFVTAWEQVNTPAGMSIWQTIEERVTNHPLTLLAAPACEGYEYYLGVAFHFQRLAPRKDILLPVKILSGLLTKLVGKQVSEQSVSHYCRLARNSGYIALVAKAHHPSGKAARYRFDLTRFTETGLELNPDGAPATTDCSHGSHGIDGSHGNQGTDGFEGIGGIEENNKSVLKHASSPEYILNNPKQGEEITNVENVLDQTARKKQNEEKEHEEPKETQAEDIGCQVADGGYAVLEASETGESGWMNAGKPLPKALMPIPDNIQLKALISASLEDTPFLKTETHPNTVIPTSAKAGVLAAYWKARLDELEPHKYHAPLKNEGRGMIGQLGTKLGDEAGRVIDFALRHWTDFGWKALNNDGEKAYPPKEPKVGFLLKHHETAANMMLDELKSIAKKKTAEKTIAEKAIQGNKQTKSSEALKPKEVPVVKLSLTPKQLDLYLEGCEAFIDKVTEKYGEWKPAHPDDKHAVPCDINIEGAA